MIVEGPKYNYWQKRIAQGLAILRKVSVEEKIALKDYEYIEKKLKPYLKEAKNE